MMIRTFVMLLLPGLAGAELAYQMTTESFGRMASGPASTQYSIDGTKIWVNSSDGTTIFIFRDDAIYVLDSPTRSAQVMRQATLEEHLRLRDALRDWKTRRAIQPVKDVK